MINRGVVIVRPREPFIDWAANLDDSGIVPQASDERTVYLIPNYNDDLEAWRLLSKVYEEIFENELWGWHTDEAAWPKQRSFIMFKEWFAVEFHSIVEDLCEYEIIEEND